MVRPYREVRVKRCDPIARSGSRCRMASGASCRAVVPRLPARDRLQGLPGQRPGHGAAAQMCERALSPQDGRRGRHGDVDNYATFGPRADECRDPTAYTSRRWRSLRACRDLIRAAGPRPRRRIGRNRALGRGAPWTWDGQGIGLRVLGPYRTEGVCQRNSAVTCRALERAPGLVRLLMSAPRVQRPVTRLALGDRRSGVFDRACRRAARAGYRRALAFIRVVTGLATDGGAAPRLTLPVAELGLPDRAGFAGKKILRSLFLLRLFRSRSVLNNFIFNLSLHSGFLVNL